MTLQLIRTPDERFEDLEDYPFEPNYVQIKGLRIHYVEEGDPSNPLVLLLHGEPSWSYLYRHMIPLLVENGFRVIAPDLPGFGRSDKILERSDYSYQLLVDVFTEFIEKLDLTIEVMFMQDWGSLIGFRLMETMGERIQRILLSNGAFPTASGLRGYFGHFLFRLMIMIKGSVTPEELAKNPNFANWVALSQTIENFDVGYIIQGASNTDLSEKEIEAYNAPFPTEEYKEGALQLPILVTSQLRKNHQVWNDVIKMWEKPFLTIFSSDDPITKGGEKKFIAKVPGASNLDHEVIKGGHFIQEDQPDLLVNEIVKLYNNNKIQ